MRNGEWGIVIGYWLVGLQEQGSHTVAMGNALLITNY
jgi:hypothetical protein